MTVTETIVVSAEGKRIKRGIYRDFPTRYPDRWGNDYVVSFDVVAVNRDGRSEAYHTQPLSNGERVYFGRKDVFLDRGRHAYEFTYRTDGQLGFFDEYDELYWNVTGDDWEFVIEHATAVVTLPDNVPQDSIKLYGYTGVAGAQGDDYSAETDPEGRPYFETTKPLRPGEGLTISLSWMPRLITRPTAIERAFAQIRNQLTTYAAGFAAVLLLIYYLVVWHRVGRDPEAGIMIPRFKPPKGLSPAAARYVYKMGFDHRAFAAAVINMAVKGYLLIEQDDKEFTLQKTGHADSSVLSPGERKLAKKLFTGRTAITLEKTNHATISKAVKALKKYFDTEYHKVYFFRNSGYLAPGFIVTVVTIVGIGMATHRLGQDFMGMALWLTVWSIGVFFLWMQRQTLMAILFTAVEVVAIVMFFNMSSTLQIGLVLTLIGVNLLFYYLLKAPTRLGRRTLDEIEGFKHYLTVAEEDRWKILNPPERTPELYERYLPYALALGVDQQWSERLADVLARATTGDQNYRPKWYRGSTWTTDGAPDFASSLGASLTSAVSSSSVAPGGSSGVGGGGSAGGGGGGGGGGGW